MPFNGFRDKALQDRRAFEMLGQGKKRRDIAVALGVSYSTLRRRLSRYVRAAGFASVEHAVAHHIAAKIRAALPLALHQIVDRALRR